ncbi:low-specificity L-threonine aldolase [Candidatus Dependentiae bacterium]|nr:low-specificity L-threonine aldolase [Candidatus Dependentiae bacterium]
MIDFRSDTVTRPTKEMLEAMLNASVGDDVLGDDPTVNELELLASRITGHPSALFLCSGTMGNQIAIRVHTSPGDEIIVEDDSHIFQYEAGGAAWNSSVQLKTIEGNFGIINIDEISNSIREDDIHLPRTSLICLENTHNNSGGVIIPIDYIKSVSELAKSKKIKTHLDGARIFNASIASGISVSDYAENFDSMMFCLSKGLASPIGSILVGDEEFIKKARRVRKVFGGGWRQAGYLAACGIISLTKMVDRLKEDHEKARLFADQLSELEEISFSIETVQTNMIYFKINSISIVDFFKRITERNLLALGHGDKIRFVFHKDVSFEDVEKAIEIIKDIV